MQCVCVYIYIYIFSDISSCTYHIVDVGGYSGEILRSNVGCRVGQHLVLIPAATAGRGFVRSESSCDGIANIAKRTESR